MTDVIEPSVETDDEKVKAWAGKIGALPEYKARLKFQTAADLLSTEEPALEWLIENVWVDRSRGFIAGNPGVGKTWLALEMLLAVASGRPCLGKFKVKQMPVLLMEEEGSERNLKRRLHAMARARAMTPADTANIHFGIRQGVKIPQNTPEITRYCHAEGIGLIIFDSLRRFHGMDENSSSEMQAVLDSFAALHTLTESSLILIHHLGKGSRETDHRPVFERMRGSSDFWAWRDCIIGLEGQEGANSVTAKFQFRDADSPLPILINRVTNENGGIQLEAGEWEDDEDVAYQIEQITEWMKVQMGPMSRNQIHEKVGGRKQDVLRTLGLMEKKGLIVAGKEGLRLVQVV